MQPLLQKRSTAPTHSSCNRPPPPPPPPPRRTTHHAPPAQAAAARGAADCGLAPCGPRPIAALAAREAQQPAVSPHCNLTSPPRSQPVSALAVPPAPPAPSPLGHALEPGRDRESGRADGQREKSALRAMDDGPHARARREDWRKALALHRPAAPHHRRQRIDKHASFMEPSRPPDLGKLPVPSPTMPPLPARPCCTTAARSLHVPAGPRPPAVDRMAEEARDHDMTPWYPGQSDGAVGCLLRAMM